MQMQHLMVTHSVGHSQVLLIPKREIPEHPESATSFKVDKGISSQPTSNLLMQSNTHVQGAQRKVPFLLTIF